MIDLSAYHDAWVLARAFEQAAIALVALDPMGALRLALMASEVRRVMS
jgi:hypothetical protein